MSTINPEKLAQLDTLTLDHGSHEDFEAGHCAMEVVSWLADLGHTDAPSCASPVLRSYTITLNDRWDAEKRQSLMPLLPRMVGTGDDGKDDARRLIAARYTADKLLGPWLRLAGLNAEADALAVVDGTDYEALRRVIRAAADAAFSLRTKRRDELAAKVRAELAKGGTVADAAAVAAAVADAAAAAAAAADADSKWSAAYRAARAYYGEHPLSISREIADLAASQEDAALDLLDLMIDPDEATR